MPLIRSGKHLISVNLHVAKIGETWLTSLPRPFPGAQPLPYCYVIKRITLVLTYQLLTYQLLTYQLLTYQLHRGNFVNFLFQQHLHSQESGSLN